MTITELAELLPASSLVTDPADVAPYATPWRGDAGRTELVVRPGTVDELRETVRWAVRNRVRLVPQGANTGLVGAGVPGDEGSSVVVTTSRLTDPLEVHPADGAVVAGAGVVISTVQELAAPHGLFLPIDLSADASVGGLVATNAGGSRVLRYGDVRRRTLAVQAVLAEEDAPVIGDLRPLRKRNDGPRITDLMIGSGGQLGIVTAAVLELAPVPEHRSTCFLIPGADVGPAMLAQHVQRLAGDSLAAVELLSEAALRLTAEHVPSQTVPFLAQVDDYVLLVEIERDEDRLLTLLDGLADLLHDAVVLEPDRAWGLRHSLSEAQRLAGHVVGLDVAVARSQVDRLRERVRSELGRAHPDALLAEFGHLGDGGMHMNVVLPSDDRELGAAIRRLVYAVVEDCGGTFSAEHGLGPINLAHWLEVTPAAERSAVAAVKRALDPFGVLGNAMVARALSRSGEDER